VTPFALSYATPRQPEPATPYSFDAERQLNVCPDGTPAAENVPVLLLTASTTSTAGSKTHFDD
jgi:putative ATP-grasp target RiPP